MSLSFTPVLKSGIVLTPGHTHNLELRFENSSEYDKQLFCTLRSPDGLLVSRNHFDVLVPAEGICIENIKISVPDGLRIFYESYFFVLETTDAVLEEDKHFAFFLKCALPWEWQAGAQQSTSKGTIFLGNAHACSFTDNVSENICFTSYLACAQESNVSLKINCDGNYEVLLNGILKCTQTGEETIPLSLTSGINKVCIKTSSGIEAITAEYIQQSDYVPACINPKCL